MQVYDSLLYVTAMVLVCLYVYLGVLSRSTAIRLGSPAIVAGLVLAYSLSPLHSGG
ncbi:hypothetical protein QO239_05605 [Cupriavidus taiwanensis]|jgi:hypothetical protein|uniref:Uncharacterized protein n=7 Tax=Cupriavidus TaxID=106589 RepID=Q0K239_CUPNH|nr:MULTISPECIES: hypothetical protein [Cupriavidus]NUO87956.1 hypothetical protein [Cupriavidus sp.]AEI80067.1 hypothetical protein CNE_2c11010 [Cupriavidus necator N-1]EON18411.1 hypothetical protein C265_18244 [Cupriavidus sp. GA3-3]KAI3599293.1 hypothetical protein D8I24_4788 [Cupriavidus necator H850]MBB2917209.1 hypothetical protein [Cupriavidus alkaliphilus]